MPFVKGQSGNPNGRPKRGKSFIAALDAALAVKDPETKQTALVRVATALVVEATKGNVAAIAMIAERLDGKVPSDVNLTVRQITERAERIAADLGLSVDEVIAEAESIVAGVPRS